MTSVRGLASCLIFVALLLTSPFGRAEALRITFLHVNDIYEVEPRDGIGGFAPLMTLIERERRASPHTIATFGGDLFSPSILSGFTKGAHMVEMMNAIGTDVAVVGNHEYDFGPRAAARNFAASEFPWLGANVHGPGGEPAEGLVASYIVEEGGLRIGFFGVTTPETATLSSPGEGIVFAPVIETARAAVEDLEARGAELIVALTHLHVAEDRALATKVEGIHLILGGHDHTPIASEANGVAIFKAGHDAHYLGVVDVRVDRVEQAGGTSLSVRTDGRLVTTAGVEPNPGIEALVAAHGATLDEELSVVIGETAVALDSRSLNVRSRETSFGNLVAEALRHGTGADVGFSNGGGIRGDRTYAAGSELTRRDILEELPFGNVTVLLELSGVDLRAALENGVSQVENMAGRFPQVAGLRLIYDPQASPGGRVVEVEVGGEVLDPKRIYRVATNDYMAQGGDGYAALAKGRRLIDASGGTLMATMVMEYIETEGTSAARTDGRIRRR